MCSRMLYIMLYYIYIYMKVSVHKIFLRMFCLRQRRINIYVFFKYNCLDIYNLNVRNKYNKTNKTKICSNHQCFIVIICNPFLQSCCNNTLINRNAEYILKLSFHKCLVWKLLLALRRQLMASGFLLFPVLMSTTSEHWMRWEMKRARTIVETSTTQNTMLEKKTVVNFPFVHVPGIFIIHNLLSKLFCSKSVY